MDIFHSAIDRLTTFWFCNFVKAFWSGPRHFPEEIIFRFFFSCACLSCAKYDICISTFFFIWILRCLSSRWDKPAQSQKNIDVKQQGSRENAVHPVSLLGFVGSADANITLSEPAEKGGKAAPQGGVEMAAAMAAKINAMLMAKGKLLTPPPLLAKVCIICILQTFYIALYIALYSWCEAYYFLLSFCQCFRLLQVCLSWLPQKKWWSQRST